MIILCLVQMLGFEPPLLPGWKVGDHFVVKVNSSFSSLSFPEETSTSVDIRVLKTGPQRSIVAWTTRGSLTNLQSQRPPANLGDGIPFELILNSRGKVAGLRNRKDIDAKIAQAEEALRVKLGRQPYLPFSAKGCIRSTLHEAQTYFSLFGIERKQRAPLKNRQKVLLPSWDVDPMDAEVTLSVPAMNEREMTVSVATRYLPNPPNEIMRRMLRQSGVPPSYLATMKVPAKTLNIDTEGIVDLSTGLPRQLTSTHSSQTEPAHYLETSVLRFRLVSAK